MSLHRLTDCVLAFDVWELTTADRKVLGDHTEILIPAFEVADTSSIEAFEGKSGNRISQLVLSEDFRWQLDRIVLVINRSNNHRMQNRVSLSRVRMSLCKTTISQRVISVVELSKVAPEIFRDHEFSSWMDAFVAISA